MCPLTCSGSGCSAAHRDKVAIKDWVMVVTFLVVERNLGSIRTFDCLVCIDIPSKKTKTYP